MTQHGVRLRHLAACFSLAATAAALSGCGGAADSAAPAAQLPAAPTPPAPPLPAPGPAPTPGAMVTLHFSDCQVGARVGCVAGNNANAGTASSPKQTLAGIDVNTLGAGSQLLFARGGAWNNVNLFLNNPNATATSALLFGDYLPAGVGASAARPELRSGGVVFNVGGMYGNSVVDGGYTFRGLKLTGLSGDAGSRGFFVHSSTRNVLIDDMEITGFGIALELQNVGATGNEGLVLRNSHIHHNSEMGILGDTNDLVIEGNLIEANNVSGSGFNHGLYLSGHARNGIVRNNRFINNSVLNGVCTGGNLTVHGQWDGLLIENNTIEQLQSTWGCWGISVNDGYNLPEYFRGVVLRGNSLVNIECAICVRAAPGIVIEGNRIRSNQPNLPTAIVVGSPTNSDDDPGVGATVRNNVVCFTAPNPALAPIRITVAGGSETGTVYRTGAEADTGACAP